MKRLFLLALLLAVPARAETPYRLYADGKYDEAVKTGLAENDASGFATAAAAALAEETSRDRPCLECLDRAETYARRAVAADPKLPDARICLVVSLGLKEHIEGPIVARLKDYPGEAKRALDAAFAADPNNPWTLASRGGWNIEIVNHGGAPLANWIYGATVKQGLDGFAAAFKAAPDNIVLRYQYALTLSEYDDVRFRNEIAESLAKVVGGTPETAYARLLQKRAGTLSELFKKGDRAAFNALVLKYLGYP